MQFLSFSLSQKILYIWMQYKIPVGALFEEIPKNDKKPTPHVLFNPYLPQIYIYIYIYTHALSTHNFYIEDIVLWGVLSFKNTLDVF